MNPYINEKVGAWLLVDGNTQTKLSELLEISRPALRTRLSGESEWKWSEVQKLSEITGATLNDFAGI